MTAWMSRGAKLAAISRTVHAYPTLAEGPARAADDHVRAKLQRRRVRTPARAVLAALRLLGLVMALAVMGCGDDGGATEPRSAAGTSFERTRASARVRSNDVPAATPASTTTSTAT